MTLLWNPATRKSKILPDNDKISVFDNKCVYGFGYEQTNDDYKVVVVFPYCQGKREVQIYSLKTGSWRKTSDFPSVVPYGSGIYVNGVLHWDVGPVCYFRDSPVVIVSFDLGNETYGEIAQPHYGDDPSYDELGLGVLEGCLSIFSHFYFECFAGARVDIWVMKEYANRDSWIKLYTVRYLNDYVTRYTPLCVSIKGEILLKRSLGCFRLYNPSNGEFGDPVIGKFQKIQPTTMAITYVESLVSPNIDDEVAI